jgi:septal ring factor EnvC (AmiA/AmiB activator)
MSQTHRPSTRLPDDEDEGENSEQKRREKAQREEQEARDEAEAKTAHLPRQGEPRQKPMTPAESAAPGEKTVKMNFPVGGVTLTLPGYRMVHFPEGVQDVPESLVEHDFFKDSGVAKV